MRRTGSRNAGYDERRSVLLSRLTERLCDRSSGWPTMRELAASAGCSVSTLRHYFGRREGVVAAVFRHVAEGTTEQIRLTRTPEGAFAGSVRSAAVRATEALYDPVIGSLLSMGLVEALSAPEVGPTFLDTMLDPFVVALAERLDIHIARGEMRPTDTRLAAMALIAPILVAALHQRKLGGAECRPLDPAAHAEQLSAMFVASYGLGPVGAGPVGSGPDAAPSPGGDGAAPR